MKSKINMQMQMKKPIAPGPVVRAKSVYNNHVPVQPPPRNKFMRKRKKRPTPQAPPKPVTVPHRLNRSVSSFEKGMHMASQSEDSVVNKYHNVKQAVNAYQT